MQGRPGLEYRLWIWNRRFSQQVQLDWFCLTTRYSKLAQTKSALLLFNQDRLKMPLNRTCPNLMVIKGRRNLFYCSERSACVAHCREGSGVARNIVWRAMCEHHICRYSSKAAKCIIKEKEVHNPKQVESQSLNHSLCLPAVITGCHHECHLLHSLYRSQFHQCLSLPGSIQYTPMERIM